MIGRAFWTVFVPVIALCASASAEPMLRILEPSPDGRVQAGKATNILWDSDFGEDITYWVSYSQDGISFSEQIASDVRTYECEWTPRNPLDLRGWVKVKAYGPDGLLRAESVAGVNFMPATSIIVSKADQKVFHFSNGVLTNVFTCSTALPKYDLDAGVYKVYAREPRHWSRKYEVWMDHTLFFFEGYALHATNMIRQLGRPASHGCVRLHPRDAKTLFDVVKVGTPVIVLPKSKDCSFLLGQAKKPAARRDVGALPQTPAGASAPAPRRV